jgi:lysine-ketoglutarate reductase/saccharopine dehydrogenase-like protein (TIGR00300 family)
VEGASVVLAIRGHILDSLTLSKALDEIRGAGAGFEIERLEVGAEASDASLAVVRVTAPSSYRLARIVRRLRLLGAEPLDETDCRTEPADGDGYYPAGFHATTNLPTSIRRGGRWIAVERTCMDCAIRWLPDERRAECVKMDEVRRGDEIVVGRAGVRVEASPTGPRTDGAFSFMSSAVSPEKSKSLAIREVARSMRAARASGGRILWVIGPVLVHCGARDPFCDLIDAGFVDLLFAGNGLAAHDIEAAIHGTSLGVSISTGERVEHGHENHLRAINAVRAAGGIAQAVESGLVADGIMARLVRRGIPFVLAGSVRDDGPLPDVISDTREAQRRMRAHCEGVSMAILLGSMLHGIATGNLLPARVRTVCVDISAETVTKLSDRGTRQSTGIVTDAEPFLRELLGELGIPEAACAAR